LIYYQVKKEENILREILDACVYFKLTSVLVEGGASLLQSFINANCWDEARIITNEALIIEQGLSAPELYHFFFKKIL